MFEIAGRAAAGLYGAASKVFDRALVIPGSILATMFPMIAVAYKEDIVRMRGLVQTAVEVLLAATLPFVALVAVIGRPLMRLLFGAEFAPAGPAPQRADARVRDLGLQLRGRRSRDRVAPPAPLHHLRDCRSDPQRGAEPGADPAYGFIAAAWVCLFTEAIVIGLALRAAFTAIDQRLRLGRISRVLAVSATGATAALAARVAGLPLVPIGAAWLLATVCAWLVLRPWPLTELRALMPGRRAP